MEPNPMDALWVALTAIGEALDEGTLRSNEAAMGELVQMLGPAVSHPYVKQALYRLRAVTDELSFRAAVGEEAVDALNSPGDTEFRFDA